MVLVVSGGQESLTVLMAAEAKLMDRFSLKEVLGNPLITGFINSNLWRMWFPAIQPLSMLSCCLKAGQRHISVTQRGVGRQTQKLWSGRPKFLGLTVVSLTS